MLHTSLSSFCVCHLTQGNLHKNTQKNMCFFLAFLLSVEALLAGRWMLIWVFFLSMYVCLVLHKWAVHKTVCVTRKMAGVGHLALYWARSSLKASKRLMQRFPAQEHNKVAIQLTGTHTVVCTAHLYSTKHTVVLIWSSWGVKNHAISEGQSA